MPPLDFANFPTWVLQHNQSKVVNIERGYEVQGLEKVNNAGFAYCQLNEDIFLSGGIKSYESLH